MKKFLFILLSVFLFSQITFASEVSSSKPDLKNISFKNSFVDANDLTLFAQTSDSTTTTKDTNNTEDDNAISKFNKLYFGLTIAFGVAAFTFLVMGIVFCAVYGVSNMMVRTTTGTDRDKWADSQSGLLAGTIASWSLFTVFAICGTATGILLIIATSGKKKIAAIEIKPTFTNVSVGVSFNL